MTFATYCSLLLIVFYLFYLVLYGHGTCRVHHSGRVTFMVMALAAYLVHQTGIYYVLCSQYFTSFISSLVCLELVSVMALAGFYQ